MGENGRKAERKEKLERKWNNNNNKENEDGREREGDGKKMNEIRENKRDLQIFRKNGKYQLYP